MLQHAWPFLFTVDFSSIPDWNAIFFCITLCSGIYYFADHSNWSKRRSSSTRILDISPAGRGKQSVESGEATRNILHEEYFFRTTKDDWFSPFKRKQEKGYEVVLLGRWYHGGNILDIKGGVHKSTLHFTLRPWFTCSQVIDNYNLWSEEWPQSTWAFNWSSSTSSSLTFQHQLVTHRYKKFFLPSFYKMQYIMI